MAIAHYKFRRYIKINANSRGNEFEPALWYAVTRPSTISVPLVINVDLVRPPRRKQNVHLILTESCDLRRGMLIIASKYSSVRVMWKGPRCERRFGDGNVLRAGRRHHRNTPSQMPSPPLGRHCRIQIVGTAVAIGNPIQTLGLPISHYSRA